MTREELVELQFIRLLADALEDENVRKVINTKLVLLEVRDACNRRLEDIERHEERY